VSWLKSIAAEIGSLFVDDGRFALAIVVWLIVVWLVVAGAALGHLALPVDARAPLLAAGLLAVLLESVLRRAGR
jgi:hypothetical protein